MSSFRLEPLESRVLLAGDDELISDESEEQPPDESSLLDSLTYAVHRSTVTLSSMALGVVEGAIVATPSWVLIKGAESIFGELSVPSKILLGLATYSLSLEFFAELVTSEEPKDPVLRCLYPIKAWVDYSNSWVDSFESDTFLDAASWAKALQPHSLKNAYWSASTTVFSGLPSGFDYPHLELPEHPRGDSSSDNQNT
tara:strand:+ start:408 stop:1001 length:594 start_codon:yes stop_codon:yes gene_type:complete